MLERLAASVQKALEAPQALLRLQANRHPSELHGATSKAPEQPQNVDQGAMDTNEFVCGEHSPMQHERHVAVRMSRCWRRQRNQSSASGDLLVIVFS